MVAPIFQYKDTSWLDSLQAYNLNTGVDLSLDWLRKIIRSGSYVFRAFGFPTPANDMIAASDSFNGNISVLPGTYLTMLNGYSSGGAGFMLQIYDEGAQTYLYNGQFGKDGAVAGIMIPPAAGLPFGPFIFTSPTVILAPGRLNVEITNLTTAQARLQILLCCAIPIDNVSFGESQGNEGSGG